MRAHLTFLLLGVLLFICVVPCGATAAAADVDPDVVGTWELTVPGPGGTVHWLWDIRANGTYEFRLEGLGAQGGHSGKFGAKDGKWALAANTMTYKDGGTYHTPDHHTFTATGQLGTVNWKRLESVTVVPENVPQPSKTEQASSKTHSRSKPAGFRISSGTQDDLTSALRQRGIDGYNAGQCSQAYGDLSHTYQANPRDKEVLFLLAECKRQLGFSEGARADYTAVVVEQPNHAHAMVGRALAHAALGDAPAARRGLAEARKIDPKLDSPYDTQLKKALGNFTTAPDDQRKLAFLEYLRESAQQGATWKSLIQLAEQVVKVSQYGRLRADEQYQLKLSKLRGAAARPNATADDFVMLGKFLYEHALIAVGEAVEPHARNRPYRSQTEKGQERELALAEIAVNRALKLNPNHPRALAFKGACRFKRANDWVAAEKYLSRAIDLAGKDPVIQDLFAIVLDYIVFVQASAASDLRSVNTWEDTQDIYYRYPSEAELRRVDELDAIVQKMWAKARRVLELAIVAAPNSAHAYYYRSILSERDKDPVGATTWLKKALDLDPKFF
ncbi:MAG: tetratricopeptide repeat protein [Nitrospirae bacterium]|nr:tetratricopeptide repeat protein [Nitrospirota bacterium]MDA1303121.1 tetratricopeptide repeat protein [Nitrospirota bacterium]